MFFDFGNLFYIFKDDASHRSGYGGVIDHSHIVLEVSVVGKFSKYPMSKQKSWGFMKMRVEGDESMDGRSPHIYFVFEEKLSGRSV